MLNLFTNGSIFEMIMLFCFGISWPLAIIKTLRSKTVKGVSPLFYFFVWGGYISGTIYKIFFNYNSVIFLYIINTLTVSAQIILYYYYKNKENKVTKDRLIIETN